MATATSPRCARGRAHQLTTSAGVPQQAALPYPAVPAPAAAGGARSRLCCHILPYQRRQQLVQQLVPARSRGSLLQIARQRKLALVLSNAEISGAHPANDIRLMLGLGCRVWSITTCGRWRRTWLPWCPPWGMPPVVCWWLMTGEAVCVLLHVMVHPGHMPPWKGC